jgi:uncharacterized protein YbjT (DUF2867 family)
VIGQPAGSLPGVEVVVAGGHGKVGIRVCRLLAERGDRARGLIRDPAQSADLESVGAEAVVADLEREDITLSVAGADAVVFAAGAGPGSGPERKRTVDYGGAVKLIEAAKANGISRYVIVSAMGAGRPQRWSAEMRPYYEAKADADRELAASGLEFTIVRPGRLTDESGGRRIEAAPELGRWGEIPRDDVAATVLATLHAPNTIGKTFDVVAGETPIEDAVRAL